MTTKHMTNHIILPVRLSHIDEKGIHFENDKMASDYVFCPLTPNNWDFWRSILNIIEQGFHRRKEYPEWFNETIAVKFEIVRGRLYPMDFGRIEEVRKDSLQEAA
jgi:hypothetical protein